MTGETHESSGQIVVTDRRQKFDSDAETHPVQEGETAPGPESVRECEAAIPPAVEVIEAGPVGPYPDDPTPITEESLKAEEATKGPNKPPTLYVPSLVQGAPMIQFTATELLPWKGVFFMVVDVKDQPHPHIVLVPMDHTKAHKKIAEKSLRAKITPRKKRVGGAPKLALVPPTETTPA